MKTIRIMICLLLLPAVALAWPQNVPQVLSQQDVLIYRQLFQAQRSLNDATIKRLANTVTDTSLFGHVAAARLLHPKTRASYPKLQSWLERYADLPQAIEIERLANSRKPAGASHHSATYPTAYTARYVDWDLRKGKASPISAGVRAAQTKAMLNTHISASAYETAATILGNPSTQKMLGGEAHAKLLVNVGKKLLREQKFAQAAHMLAPFAGEQATLQQDILWLAGFTAFRANQLERAANHFQTLAHKAHRHSHARAKAAWWAARVYTQLNKNTAAETYLQIAAQNPVTFYGQLARHQLNLPVVDTPRTAKISSSDMKKLAELPAIKRMLALVQVGEFNLAQRELKTIYQTLPRQKKGSMDETLLALSEELHLPNMAFVLAKNVQNTLAKNTENTGIHISGLYPLPNRWAPYQGFATSPAYIYAIMRQESKFDPAITSSAGAKGLMQLLPNTANYMLKKANLGHIPQWMLKLPGLNVTLGQQYITYLQQQFDSNPVYIFAAYNAGPGNVKKWQKQFENVDPITFIESIPFTETRKYVKNVLSNFWLYQYRLEETSPSRLALANGQWPTLQLAQR